MGKSFRRMRADETLQINLTPLLDVVLQLITFFMMLVHFGARIEGSTVAVRLPIAPAGMPRDDLGIDRLLVVINAEGNLIANDRPIDVRGSERWWTEQARLRRGGGALVGGPVDELPTRVIVRADRRAPYGSVRKQLAIAQNHGFSRFTLVVLRSQR